MAGVGKQQRKLHAKSTAASPETRQPIERVASGGRFPPREDPPHIAVTARWRACSRDQPTSCGRSSEGGFGGGSCRRRNLPFESREVARHSEDAVACLRPAPGASCGSGLPDCSSRSTSRSGAACRRWSIRSMARRVVEHLDELLAQAARQRASFSLGVAWGRTMRLIAKQLHSTARALCYPGSGAADRQHHL